MLVARPICARCRLKLVAAAYSRPAPRRASTSATTSLASDDLPTSTSQNRSDPTPEFRPRLTINKAEYVGTGQPKKWQPKKRESRQRILDLFERTINEKASTSPEAEIQAQDSEHHVLNRLHSHVEVLRGMKQTKTDSPDVIVAECFFLVKDKILPIAVQFKGPIPKIIYNEITVALGHAFQLKTRCPDHGTITTMDICRAWADIGDMKAPKRLALALMVLKRLVESRQSKAGLQYQSEELEELVTFWKHFAGLKRVKVGLRDDDPPFKLRTLKVAEDPTATLRSLFPQFVLLELNELLPAIAATYVLLSDADGGMTTAREMAKPLLLAVQPVIESLDKSKLEEIFDKYPELGQYVLPRATWRVTRIDPQSSQSTEPVKLEHPRSSRDLEHPRPSRELEHPRPSRQQEPYFSYASWHGRFSAAIKTRGVAKINSVWRDLVAPARTAGNRTRELQSNPELFDFVLFGYCSKHVAPADEASKSTVHVIEFMKSIGVEPTVRTFTSMIQGWKKAKQLSPIHHLWSQIVQSGIKLDKEIWTTKIAAESVLGGPTDGIKALQDMSATWKQAVEDGTQMKAVKPVIVCINACISGLLQRDQMDSVQQVLAWASQEKIEPDVFTYNMLLGKSLKKGLGGAGDSLLQMMQKQGVAPDGATFSIILEAAMTELQDQSPEQQRETIERVFDEMDACGIKPNQEIYAKMLHVLLPAGDGLGNAVMAHLRRSGKQPTTHICTILAQHYFSRDPPNLDAVKSLVADRRVKTRDLTDRVFWEMVMKGYAECGDTGSALEIFYDLDEWAVLPTLPPLEPVLRALIHKKEWDAAKKLVQTVWQQSRPQVKGRQVKEPDARYWKHAFWGIVRDYELLEEEREG